MVGSTEAESPVLEELGLAIADQGAFTGREGGTGALCTWFEDEKGSKVGLRGREGMREGCSGPRGFLGGVPGGLTGRLAAWEKSSLMMCRRARRLKARREGQELTFAAPASCEPLASAFACSLAPVSTLSVALDIVFRLSLGLASPAGHLSRVSTAKLSAGLGPCPKPAARSPTRRERRTRAVSPYPDSARSRAPTSNAPYSLGRSTATRPTSRNPFPPEEKAPTLSSRFAEILTRTKTAGSDTPVMSPGDR